MKSFEEDVAALCFLHSLTYVGQKSLWKIKEYFGGFVEVFFGDEETLKKAGLTTKAIQSILAHKGQTLDTSNYEKIKKQNIRLITIENENYPLALKNIYDPPYLLYGQGTLEPAANALGIVGARIPSHYGRSQAYKIAEVLAKKGLTIVSGLARGIDTEAHKGALAAKGKTTAVLGSGLMSLYPAENRKLAEQIAESGAVISEYPPLMPPEPGNFPARNRIISGLSQGVLVVEAKEKSGALITADFALEQGRDVYALPGPITSELSRGTNRLIQQGAKLILGPEDILEDSQLEPKLIDFSVLSSDEEKIILLLKERTLHIDEIFRETTLEFGVLTALLLQLELKGYLQRLAGSYYTLG